MCGIVGYMGKNDSLDIVVTGLKHLEYRGYDSAGIALRAHEDQSIVIKKAVGKLSALEDHIKNLKIKSTSGMGHTRWATHGVPSLENAHPHRYGRVTLVHNGILENHHVIKQKLISEGHQFYSNTDTEVAAHLLDTLLNEGREPLEAIASLCDMLSGAYAFGIMIDDDHERMYFAKHASPLVVAKNQEACFFASDQAALVDWQPVYYRVEDGDIGFISTTQVEIFNLKRQPKPITWSKLTAHKEAVQKVGHKHFMHKEIFEQTETISRVLQGRLNENGLVLSGFGLDFDRILKAQKIDIIACGSSYFAGLIAKPELESLLKIPVNIEIASEYRYRNTVINDQTLVIALSQSGETVDTLAALKKAQEHNALCMSICNVLGSAIPSAAATSVGNLFLHAGPEISVASTKAFIAQLVALKLFTFALLKIKGRFSSEDERMLFEHFNGLKNAVAHVLARDNEIKTIANSLMPHGRMLYIGRGEMAAVALEGALKMKELSYIFAEGYPAGELKHGPIATVEPGVPVVVLFNSSLAVKTASNLQEVKARGAHIISIGPKNLDATYDEADVVFDLDPCHPMLEPILTTIPLQLLAYHLSDLKGIDVDKPRNLAKSVTVE